MTAFNTTTSYVTRGFPTSLTTVPGQPGRADVEQLAAVNLSTSIHLSGIALDSNVLITTTRG